MLSLINVPQVQTLGHQLCQYGIDRLLVKSRKSIRRFNRITGGVGLHRAGQFWGVAEVIHLLQKPEPVSKRRAEFIGVAIIHALLTQHLHVTQ